MNGLNGRPWSEVHLEELITVELLTDEREMLWQGLHQWGGPTRPTDALARVMGFEDVKALHHEGKRIRARLRSCEPLSRRDWQRSLVALEFVWASGYYGAARDWEIVSAYTDEVTLRVLREIQRKFAGLRQEPRPRS